VIKQEEPHEGKLSQLVPIFSSGYVSPVKTGQVVKTCVCGIPSRTSVIGHPKTTRDTASTNDIEQTKFN